MDQEKVVFSLVGDDDGIQAEIEGSGRELVELLATVMVENEEVLTVIEMALLAAKMEKSKSKDDGDEPNEDYLTDLFSKLKPTAQA
jgi:hypothetical protein